MFNVLMMMGEVSLETSPKNIMIQDMINSEKCTRNFVIEIYQLDPVATPEIMIFETTTSTCYELSCT